MPTNPDFATTTLRVTRWHDPIVDERGYEPRSGYVERFWLPVIGPTASWIYRSLTDDLHAHPCGLDVDLGDFAAQMGLAHRADRTRRFDRALERCIMFGLAQRNGDTLAALLRTERAASFPRASACLHGRRPRPPRDACSRPRRP